MTSRSSRNRGFSLVEMMIALGLASIVSAGLLMLTRTQLQAFQQNDQVNRAQQNARAGMNFVENVLRRACGGMSLGEVALNVPGVAQATVPCVRFFDGASLNGGSFTGGAPTTNSDAIGVVYGYGSLTAATAALTATPSIAVVDVSGFSVGDFVLIVDHAMTKGALFKLASITPGTAPAGTLTFSSPGGAIVYPSGVTLNSYGGTLNANTVYVMRAKSVSLYVDTTAGSVTLNSLMYDPDGPAGTAHTDAEPLIENVGDFQIAVGFDNVLTDGVITEASPGTSTDEWVGNATGEAAISSLIPWGNLARQIRVGILVQTSAKYSGAATTEQALENRPAPTVASTGGNPRWRPLRMVVAPRAWNLLE